MSMTRAVRLTFLCAAAALVACGRSPARLASPDPASLAEPRAQTLAGQQAPEVAVDLGLAPSQAQGQAQAPASAQAPAAAPAEVAPDSAAAPDLSRLAPPEVVRPSGDGNSLDGSELAAGAAQDLDAAGLAAQAEKVLGPAPEGIATMAAAAASSKGRSNKFKALGFWGSSPDVADRVYGNLGWTYANLWWDDYYGTINGSLDGRTVRLTDDVDSLRGSIGWSSVDLRRYSGWWTDTVRGYLGGHYVNIQVNNGSLRGYEGSTYLNTYTGWDGRSLKGTYGGYKVNVSTSGSYVSGSIGYANVRINSGYSAISGYMGSKSMYLQGNLSKTALLRRLPLLAANDWMVISTLTEFFD